MSFRRSTEKTSPPTKQQIESRPPDNEGNDIDAVVEQIPFQSIQYAPFYVAVVPFQEA